MLKISSMKNPNRDLTSAETITQLLPLFGSDIQLLAVNLTQHLVLLKNSEGILESFSYCVSHVSSCEPNGFQHELQHYLLGVTHHTNRDFKTLFGLSPIGKLSFFKSASDFLFVDVFRVGRRRKMIDEVGNIFVKVSGRFLKFPDQVSY